MTVPFNNIPQQVRVPLFYAEMDNSQANGIGTGIRRALLIGQKLAAGSAAANQPYIVATVAQAIALFGRGSMLARMVEKYRANDTFGELWCIAVADVGAGVAATGTVTVTGTATAAGTLNLYIAGQRVQVPVLVGDSATVVGASIVTALTAALDLPVTGVNAAGVVTLTCKWKGPTGNDITILDSFQGSAGGESVPAGITLAYGGSGLLTGGTSNPVLTPVITAMGDDEYDFIGHPRRDHLGVHQARIRGHRREREGLRRKPDRRALRHRREPRRRAVPAGLHQPAAGVRAAQPVPPAVRHDLIAARLSTHIHQKGAHHGSTHRGHVLRQGRRRATRNQGRNGGARQ